MTLRVRTLGASVLVAMALGSLTVACGNDDPDVVVDDGPVPSETATQVGTESPPASDDDVLRRLAEDVADDQRPGDFISVTNVTYFEDPEGCESGEAAFVSVELSGQPDAGEILFCRVEAEPGWELSQGILYGE